jgi:hypothetical protein
MVNLRAGSGGTSPPSVITSEEAAKLIRFALSELSAENAHHDFEHLCRHLTRRKICPNIIPSTGPVSGGGDQGADFETYKVVPSGAYDVHTTDFFARAVHEKWLFACSLEENYKKKVKEDLSAAKDFGERVDRLVFFHHRSIKTSDRNKLKKEAKQNYGMELEIFDGPAIGEMLADQQTSWIAKRYLSIPSEFVLPPEGESPDWFDTVLKRIYDPKHITSAEFFELKDAIRFATWRPEHHSNLAKLLRDLAIFRAHPFVGISRKAIYEEFVASLRGLETTTGLENSLRGYFSAVASLTDTAELEDAAVLLTYALAAQVRGILDIPLGELREWHSRLWDLLQTLEREHTTPGRQCALLFVEGHLALNSHLRAADDPKADRNIEIARAANAAVRIWRKLTKKVPEAPLFPVERLANLVNKVVVQLEGVSGRDQLIREIDAISVGRSGQQKEAEHHIARARSFMEAKQYLRALDELHKAHRTSFLSETTFQVVALCLQLAQLYAELNLFFAAKYYGLAAVFAALKLPGERLPQFAYAACAEAASADYSAGGSLLFFLTAHLFVMIASEYSMGGSDERKQNAWARIDYHAMLLARGSVLLYEKLHTFIVETILPPLGLAEVYARYRNELDEFFSDKAGLDAIAAKAVAAGIAPPFSDVGGLRRAAWRQLGLVWRFEWKTEYEIDRQAHALAAYLQILLADFADVELSIIPGEVFVRIEVHDGELEILEAADNDRVSRLVRLPKIARGSNLELSGIAESVAAVLLKTVSALPHDKFEQRYKGQLARGLSTRLRVYRPSESLFEEFYSRDSYDALYAIGRSSIFQMPEHIVETWKGLDGPQGDHPDYSRSRSLAWVRNRYKNAPPLLLKTLPRLLANTTTRRTLHDLKQQGWRDWHLLLAIENIQFNYLAKVVPEYKEAMERGNKEDIFKLRFRSERDLAVEVPLEEFTLEEMMLALELSQVSTLTNLGLRVYQLTPNFRGVDKLLSRFRYWDDDVPHQDFFPGLTNTPRQAGV